ncbi:holo-[acyl-carrier-protein] synthase [Treponema bryantii]|jgi:holo-[acyl-carrier protein] synthase|uniref:Holo-[acyl-carrier-protein] synthase n=1 Tax=Treponema bryantii TaxID=163 RepID=A0A1H9I865_9SPIR|nr:holo-ACP synthase [Treponema bryantii]SEQ70757.1 holo-[acyl-carrier-protein] synthase [Treponema bryantii]
MIAGIGTDIAEVKRFEKWVKNPEMIERFFNEKERSSAKSDSAKCQHYAVRFAAKEAFSKALGTGIIGFNLKDVYITNNSEGKPELNIEGAALSLLKERLGDCNAFVSLSHEKEYAVAFVILEKK